MKAQRDAYRRAFVLATLSLLWVACASVQEEQLAANQWRITCAGSLAQCAKRADAICRERGYTVNSGHSGFELLDKDGRKPGVFAESELVVSCGEAHFATPINKIPEGAPPPAAAISQRACVPGATQRCVGPGGCEGGHACSSDGSGYGPCDCGPSASTP